MKGILMVLLSPMLTGRAAARLAAEGGVTHAELIGGVLLVLAEMVETKEFRVDDLNRVVGDRLSSLLIDRYFSVDASGVVNYTPMVEILRGGGGKRLAAKPEEPSIFRADELMEIADEVDPVVLTMPCKKTKESPSGEWVLRRSVLDRLASEFPGVDVMSVAHRFAGWWKAKPPCRWRGDWVRTLESWLHTELCRSGQKTTVQSREDERRKTMAEAYHTANAKHMAELCSPRLRAIFQLEELQKAVGGLTVSGRVRLAALKMGLEPGAESTPEGEALITKAKSMFFGEAKSG